MYTHQLITVVKFGKHMYIHQFIIVIKFIKIVYTQQFITDINLNQKYADTAINNIYQIKKKCTSDNALQLLEPNN